MKRNRTGALLTAIAGVAVTAFAVDLGDREFWAAPWAQRFEAFAGLRADVAFYERLVGSTEIGRAHV